MYLKDLCDIRSGTSFSKKPVNREQGDYWVLESFCLNGSGEIDASKLVHVASSDLSKPKRALESSDILIRSKGTHHQALLFAGCENKAPIFPTSYFLVLSVKQPSITNPEFLVWLLNQRPTQCLLSQLAGGATIKHLTKTRISQLCLDIPSLEKQIQILALDALIQKERRLLADIALLKEHYYSHITTDMFMKDLGVKQ